MIAAVGVGGTPVAGRSSETKSITTAVETGEEGLPSFGSAPGFGVLAALVALLLVGLVGLGARYSRR